MGQLTGGPHATLIGCLGAASLCLFCRSPNTQFRTESLRYNIGDEAVRASRKMACVGKAPEFDAGVESFGTYARRLEQYFIANGIVGADQDSKRRAVFLSVVGAKTFGLLEDLVAPTAVSDCTYSNLVEVLEAHFEPQTSTIVARFRFHSCCRGDQEGVSAFLARLRKLAKPCQFAAGVLEEMLRDRLVCGIKNERLQSRLLSEPHLTLPLAVELAQAHESAAASAAELSGHQAGVSGESAVHQMRRAGERPAGRTGGGPGARRGPLRPAPVAAPHHQRSNSRDGGSSECPRCLRAHHQSACPFRGKQCFSCGQRGHIRAACGRWSQQHLRQLTADDPPSATAMQCDDSASDELPRECWEAPDPVSAEAGDGAYALYSVKPSECERRPPLMVRVALDGRVVDMELDTGAALSVCSDSVFRQLWPRGGPKLEPCEVKLRTYSGEPLVVCGRASVEVDYDGTSTRLPLIVVEGDGPCLFGRNWLSHIRLDWPTVCRVSPECRVQPILDEFPDVFRDELGCYRGGEVNIEIDPDVQPRFFKPRSVPLAYRETVDAELEKQIQQGLWEPVHHSKWAAPLVVVPKADGKLRICGDYKLTINRAAKVDQYPLPRVEELFSKLSGCKVFSKIDLKSAYNQLVLDEKSREFLTVNTPRGLLRPLRLSYGYASAVSLFQRTMETLLAGVPGVGVFLDDLVVAGADVEGHDATLRTVLRRLDEAGLRVNLAKCQFGVESVTYLGLKISSKGVETTGEKTAAIREAPEPRNVGELRKWLGLVNYYAKFLKNLSNTLAPLYRLLRKGVSWRWAAAEKAAFQAAKDMLSEPPVLAHFDPALPVVLACDAGPYGVGCVLSQLHHGRERPVAFYSRALSDTETRYSQTDREALAVVTGVKKFNYYLAGRTFRIQSDHKPLLGLLGEQKPLSLMASPRMVRWALLLGAYDYRLEYRPGSKQGHCDALSRLPPAVSPVTSVPVPAETVHLLEFFDASPVNVSQLRMWTSRDPILSAVYKCVRDGGWESLGDLGPDIQPYKSRVGELSIQGGCVMWGSRVVIPPQGRPRLLKLLHEGHPGESRSKMLARMYMWWPKLDDDIRDIVRACEKCQERKGKAPESPLHPWQWPSRPWERVHIDYCEANGRIFFILVDAHSKWIEVYPARTLDSEGTIDKLRMSFACWGIPNVLVSDNAQCFVSKQFETFCQLNGIRHLTTPCLSPKSNGLAERAVQTFKNGFYKQTTGSVETKVSRFLFRYRTTPHSLTLRSPAELFLGRQPRTHLAAVTPDISQHVSDKQYEQKCRRDKGAQERDVGVGDTVYVSAVDRLRGMETCRWVPGVVMGVNGLKFTIELCDGRIIVRHADQVRKRYCEHSELHSPKNVLPSRPAVTVLPSVPVVLPPVPPVLPSVPAGLGALPPVPTAPVAAAAAVAAPAPAPAGAPMVVGARSRAPPPLPSPARNRDTSGAPSPARPTVSTPAPGSSELPRYSLRNRATLKHPDKLVYGVRHVSLF